MPGTAIVAGVGPGFCESFARKLGREGHPVALLGRSVDYLEDFAAELRADGHEALAHTASTTTGSSGELDPARLEEMWCLYAYGGLLCVREALPDLREHEGTVPFFGAHPDSGDYAFKSTKDATRGLARSLAECHADEFQVSHVVVAGGLLNPDVSDGESEVEEAEYIDIEGAAETCCHLVEQEPRARSFELDLHAHGRPDVQAL
jgi:NAD(P)-dependent dehydrogenase (short-subunit alcohol dehydrogenase family)